MTGTELYADIEHACSLYENWIDVEVDGAVTQHFVLPVGRNRVCIFRGMERDEMKHVWIIRDTQAMHDDPENALDIHVLWSDGIFSPVERKKVRLEFVGDSLTSGEGLNGAVGSMAWNPGFMNASLSFPYLTAKMMNAEYRCVSESGWGVASSWDGNRAFVIPPYYEQVAGLLIGEKNRERGAQDVYDFSSWRPDAVIVNLGTNDMNASAHTQEGLLRESIRAFLRMVRKDNPKAEVIWAYGLHGHAGEAVIRDAVETYASETKDVHMRYLSLTDTAPDEMGSREHPGLVAHARAAREIVSVLRERIPG